MSAVETNFSEQKALYQDNRGQTFLETRIAAFMGSSQRIETPPFPRYLQVEVSNICNHGCSFCAYPLMERGKRHMERALFERLVTEAHALGAREIGLFSGAEPLTCKWLDQYVALCRRIGYEYIYISTNGSLGGPERFRALLDAGLTSIKFSINGGTRESYRRIHGSDHFDAVCETIRFVAEYRRTLPNPVFLGISFVACAENEGSFEALRDRFDGLVDEVVRYEAANQSGQMPHLPPGPIQDCNLPFNKVHISVEGYLRACCNDYENALAMEDLAVMPLRDAWYSERFRQLRRRHLEDALGGSLCGACIRGLRHKIDPINPALSSLKDSTHFQPASTVSADPDAS